MKDMYATVNDEHFGKLEIKCDEDLDFKEILWDNGIEEIDIKDDCTPLLKFMQQHEWWANLTEEQLWNKLEQYCIDEYVDRVRNDSIFESMAMLEPKRYLL